MHSDLTNLRRKTAQKSFRCLSRLIALVSCHLSMCALRILRTNISLKQNFRFQRLALKGGKAERPDRSSVLSAAGLRRWCVNSGTPRHRTEESSSSIALMSRLKRLTPSKKRSTSSAAGDGAAGHHADEMGAVFGAGMDVGVEPVLFDRDVLDRVGCEGARQCGFHFGHAEDDGTGAGDRNAHTAAGARDKDSDDRIARGGIAEFGSTRPAASGTARR